MTSDNPIVHILGHCSSSHEGACWYWETSEKRRNLNHGSVWFEEQQQQAIEAYIAERVLEAKMDEWQYMKDNMSDGQTINSMAPSHDNYILKVAVVENRLRNLDYKLDQLKSNERGKR